MKWLLTLSMLGNFGCYFLSSADLFKKLTFSTDSFRNNIRMSNSLDPSQYEVNSANWVILHVLSSSADLFQN